MGCGGSSPVKEDEDQQKQQAQKGQADKGDGTAASAGASVVSADDDGKADGKKGGKSNTRARRLSYVTGDANGNAKQDGGASPPSTQPAVAHPTSTPRSASEKTRGRRLSYVTKDANVMPQPADGQEAEPEGETVEEGGASMSVGPAADVKAQPPPLRVSVACMSRAGKEPGFKKTNQDNCFAFEKYITEDQSLFGAMDGHGPHGHLVSGFVKQHLPIILVNHLTSQKDVPKALSAGFIEVDKSLGGSRIDCEFSGSTAVVSYLKGRTLTTAWVGDSRGVIARHAPATGWQAVDLTNDHKPTNPEEKARILRSNGRVERLVDENGQPMGPFRVWLQYAWIPGLAMSRALGDVLAHQVGVASEPEHSVHELDATYKFMILASDGVWEFISSKEAVEIVAQYDTVEEACRQLVDEAYQRWLTEEEGVVDDITAVVVRFLHNE